MSSSPLVLATRSAGKLRELRPLFAAAGIEAIDLRDAGIVESPAEDAIECHDTFEENARAKARYFHRRTGLRVVADDSGLEVLALGGRPGVRSKRWSGRAELSGAALDAANNALLVTSLVGVPDRRARYVCVAAYADNARVFSARGEVEGEMLDVPRGTEGFGYDQYFRSRELGVTFGEASIVAKEVVSHRGRAFRELLRELVAPATAR
ncbi:MAG: non-canonical purine NTP pyrophosphatase [Gemmatimonadaceae bacterium]